MVEEERTTENCSGGIAMSRFILRYTARRPMPAADLERIRSAPDVTLLDSSSSRMLLVQAPPEALQRLVESLPGWTCAPEQTIPLPGPRPKISSS
jgi:hypothetical protein